MNAWLIAAGVLVAVLAFEFLMFRHVGTGSNSDGATARSAGRATGNDGGDGHAGETASRDGPSTPPIVDAFSPRSDGGGGDDRHCPQCGTPNDDAASVTFCRECLSRIQ